VAGILALDYPEDRLDVKLLVEEDDSETRRAAEALDLPACVEVLVVPDVGPRGKPRACNFGLRHARGRYLVIYDAEDRPEPDQLRKSVLAFRDAPDDVICLQAQLNYFNRSHNLLTRWFTAEYSVWFDQLLPGLQAMDVVIPLGGTSNHFVTARLDELGGWNAFNVTEDADLGLRIYLEGWKTAILATTTYEEATSRYHNWIRQRSRWTKGYMQTYLFHMRRPFRMARQMGATTFVTFQLFFGASTLCLLLNPVFWLLAVLWFGTHLHLIEEIFPAPVMYLGTIALFVGNAACILSAVSGCFGRRNYEDVKYAFLIPLYWVLMSVGAWKALIQLCYKPSYWEKTEHGFCRFEDVDGGGAAGAGGAAQNEPVPVGALAAT
jgi:cellulose synthase/poly-beta-1,6-N-acetylglucosamine synthase-like glycosyltransferase